MITEDETEDETMTSDDDEDVSALDTIKSLVSFQDVICNATNYKLMVENLDKVTIFHKELPAKSNEINTKIIKKPFEELEENNKIDSRIESLQADFYEKMQIKNVLTHQLKSKLELRKNSDKSTEGESDVLITKINLLRKMMLLLVAGAPNTSSPQAFENLDLCKELINPRTKNYYINRSEKKSKEK